MTRQEIHANLLRNIKWVQRAIIVLDNNNAWRSEEDAKMGKYMATWLRRKNGLGNQNQLTGQYVEKGRTLTLQYVEALLKIALTTTQERIKRVTALIQKGQDDLIRLVEQEANLVRECSYLPGMEPRTESNPDIPDESPF